MAAEHVRKMHSSKLRNIGSAPDFRLPAILYLPNPRLEMCKTSEVNWALRPRLQRPLVQSALVDNCLICQFVNLMVEREISSWVQLPHEDHDHLFLRVNREPGIEEPAPVVFSGRTEFCERSFDAVHSKTKAERRVGTDCSQLIVSHQFNGFSTQQARVPRFAFIQHHLAKT